MRARSLTTVVTLLLSGCSSDTDSTPQPAPDDTQTGDSLLEPPPAGAGVQYRMVSTIEPGQEIERCLLVVAPPEGLHVRHEQVRFSPGSHHVLLYRTPYREIPTEDLNGVPMDGTKIHDCTQGASALWELNGVVAGSQSFDGDSLVGELPEGVAMTIEPGTVLVMNTHYLNASSDPVEAEARINLHTIAKEEVEIEAGVLFFYNPFIHVPANSTATARMRCPVSQDISIVALQSHMHRRGVDFVAALTDQSGARLQEIYTNTNWEGVPVKRFEPALEIAAGQALDYRCTYENAEAQTVIQGLTTKDEMCMLIGPYYPRDPYLETCTDNSDSPIATWIGDGSTRCGDTLGCVASASSDEAFFGCVVESCPAASEQVSAMLRCQASDGRGACAEVCSGAGDCTACLLEACAPEITACQSATCE